MNKIGFGRACELLRKGAFLVDIRDPVAFRDGHIPGAANLPLRNFVNAIMSLPDKSKPVIVYAETFEDVSLSQGVVYAQNLGFRNVYVSTYATLKEEVSYRPPVVIRQKPAKKKKGP
jgi:rhodanese-related sulfurtransferase